MYKEAMAGILLFRTSHPIKEVDESLAKPDEAQESRTLLLGKTLFALQEEIKFISPASPAYLSVLKKLLATQKILTEEVRYQKDMQKTAELQEKPEL